MSFRGNLLRAGIDSDGKVVTIYRNDGRLDVLTASSVATGTRRSTNIEHTVGATNTGVLETFRASLASEYRTGSWANAIVGQIDYGSAGDSAGGMAASICGEMLMPAKDMHNLGGGYYCFDAEIEIPDNCVLMTTTTTRPVAFMKFGAWGTDVGEFDDKGFLFHVDGLTAGSGHLLSANARTLRVNIEGALKYIYLSDTEDDLGTMAVDTITITMAGTDGIVLAGTASDCGIEIDGGTADGIRIDGTCSDSGIEILGVCTDDGILIDYTLPNAAARAFYVDVDSAVASDNIQAAQITLTNTAAANNARALQSNLIMASNCAGPYGGYFTTDMVSYQSTGLAAALGMELILPSAAITTGEFHGMTIDIACTASSGIGAGKHSFIKFETWGNQTAENAWDDGANLFFLNGMTSAAGNIISASESTIRINIEGTSRYLMLSHAEDALDFTSTANTAVDIDSTVSASSGNLNVFDLDVTNDTNGIVNFRGLTVDLTMGANCSGPYAGYFRTDIVDYTVAGLSAALGIELVLSSVAGVNGEAHGMTIDVGCPVGSDPGGTVNSKHSFIKVETWGDATAMGKWDDYANLFFINGPTSGSGNLVSANEQTLRINIEGTARYLLVSQAEDCLSLTTTATPIVIAAGSAATACIGMSGILAGTNSRAISCVVSQPNAAHGDGYGCNEFDVTLTGTSTSHVAALSSWINITAAGTHGGGGVYINAASLGVYIGATPTIAAARVNFGFRASYQGGQSPANLHLISYSSPGVDITSMFHIGQFHSNVGCVAAAGEVTAASTCVKFMSDDGGNVKYIRLYDDVN